MPNGWTPERRAMIAARIREWEPWKKSTGRVTAKGKRKSSKNASRSWRARFKRELRAALHEQNKALKLIG
jgi:hypothetical protein